jgi:hypothetical protein
MPTHEPTPAELSSTLQAMHAAGLLQDVATLDRATPTQQRLVRMHARLLASGLPSVAPVRHREPVLAPQPPHPATSWRPPPRRQDLFDPKTAAAGTDASSSDD